MTEVLLYKTWKNCFWLLALTVPAQLSLNRICYQQSQPEIEVDIMERFMRHCACTHVQRRRLNEWKKNEKNKNKEIWPKNKDEPTACTHFATHSVLRHFFYSQRPRKLLCLSLIITWPHLREHRCSLTMKMETSWPKREHLKVLLREQNIRI